MLINDYKQPDLLKHEVTTNIINKKWNQFGWRFYAINFVFYCIFLAALTFYVWTSIPLSPQSYPNLYTCSPYFNESIFPNQNLTYVFPEKYLERQNLNWLSRGLIEILALLRLLSVIFGQERKILLFFLPQVCYVQIMYMIL